MEFWWDSFINIVHHLSAEIFTSDEDVSPEGSWDDLASQREMFSGVTSLNLIKHGRACIGKFLLSSIFRAAFSPINQQLRHKEIPSPEVMQSKTDATYSIN